MITAVLMLTSSAFCLKIVTKGKSVYFGKLIVDYSRTTNEAMVKNWHDQSPGDTDGYQSDQPRLTGTSVIQHGVVSCSYPKIGVIGLNFF